jgi:hypothetical protein
MPFVSKAQRKWMYANKPEMAKKWEKHTPKDKKLPKKQKVLKDNFEVELDNALGLLNEDEELVFESNPSQDSDPDSLQSTKGARKGVRKGPKEPQKYYPKGKS